MQVAYVCIALEKRVSNFKMVLEFAFHPRLAWLWGKEVYITILS